MIQVTFNQNTIEYILMILMRVSAFIFIAPFFGDKNVPLRVKISISVFISILIFYSRPIQQVQYSTVIDFAGIVIKESIVGLLIGFSAYICVAIINFSGKIIDMEIGLSMAEIFDPTTNMMTGLTGGLYSNLLMLLLIISNMHIFLINALVDSFKLIPIGGIKFGPSMYTSVISFMTSYFIIGFRIVLPMFTATLLLNCILGIMARISPQMNMFAVGMQLKIMVGFGVMFITVSLLPSLGNFIFSQMKYM